MQEQTNCVIYEDMSAVNLYRELTEFHHVNVVTIPGMILTAEELLEHVNNAYKINFGIVFGKQ